MNIIQENLEPSKIPIELRNRYISGIELKVITCKDPHIAFKFIEEIVTNQLNYQSEKLQSELDKTIYRYSNNNRDCKLDSVENISYLCNYFQNKQSKIRQYSTELFKKTKIEDEEVNEYELFREYLDRHGKQDIYSFTWRQINSLVNQFLNVIEDSQQADKIIQLFKDYSGKVGHIKNMQGLNYKDISDLSQIKLCSDIADKPMKGFQGLDVLKYFVNPSQTQIFDLDNETLESRIIQCQSIKEKIEKIIHNSIMDLEFYNENTFTFAPVKGLERSSTKLSEQHEKILRNQESSSPSSALQMLKDILRCSIITRSPAESANVVSRIERIPGVRVIEFKNGFYTEDLTTFDRTKQADIKLILRVGGFQNNMCQEELVEVQIIQDINIKLKKLEHKIQDFIREENSIQYKVSETASLFKHFKSFMTSYSESAATQVINSRVSNLSFVKDRLVDQYPTNQLSQLDIDQIFRSRFSWRNTKFEQMFNKLDILKNAQGAFDKLKIVQNNNEYDVEFIIDQTKLNDSQKIKFEKSRNKILSEGKDFALTLSRQIGIQFIQQVNGEIHSMVFSLDGHFIQIGGKSEITKVCTKSGQVIQKYTNHSDTVTSLALSANGLYLQSGSFDKCIFLQNTSTGDIVFTYQNHSSWVTCLALSADGQYLQSGSRDMSVVKQSTKTGKLLATQRHHTAQISCLALSVDGKYLQSGSWDLSIVMQCTQTGKFLSKQNHHSAQVSCIALSVDGLYLQSGSWDATIVKQRIATGEMIDSQRYHKDQVSCLALSVDGKEIQSGSSEGTIIKQSTTTGEQLATQRNHKEQVSCLELSSDGSNLQSASLDECIMKICTITSDEVATFRLHKEEVSCLTISKNGQYLQSGSDDESIVKQSTTTQEELATQRHHSDRVCCLALSSDGLTLQSGSSDCRVVMQNTETGDEISSYTHFRTQVSCIALSQDDLQLYTGLSNGIIVKQNAFTGEKIQTQRYHTDRVSCLMLSSDGLYLYTGSLDGSVVKQNTSTGEEITKQEHDSHSVSCIALSQDDLQLQTGISKGIIEKQFSSNGKTNIIFKSFSIVNSIILQDQFLISALEDGTVSIFQNLSGILVKSVKISNVALRTIISDKLESQTIQISDSNGMIASLEI